MTVRTPPNLTEHDWESLLTVITTAKDRLDCDEDTVTEINRLEQEIARQISL